jgi:putative protease
MEEMAEGIAFAHAHGVRVYVTANILAHNYDLAGVREYFAELNQMKPDRPDALIISDPGVFQIAGEVCPEIERHVSTQANNTNYGTYMFWYGQGAKRVVTARELSLKEIQEIRANIPEDLEIETFVHGAMCISYSGRCLLSNYFTGRDANKGACTHPCRWKYAVVEETRPGEYFPVYENERGTYIFNSKDLCMIEHIPDLVDAGIDSWKIEGRMKTALYVATVARTYRKAIDDYLESPEKYEQNMPWYMEQIKSCTYRQFTTGFFYGKPSEEAQIYDSNTYEKGYTYLGIVGPKCGVPESEGVILEETEQSCRDNAEINAKPNNPCGMYRIEQRNKFSVGETIEVMKPNGENIPATVRRMVDAEGNEMDSCPHPKQVFYVDLGMELDEYDILRRAEDAAECQGSWI